MSRTFDKLYFLANSQNVKDNEEAFYQYCSSGKLKMAKMLLYFNQSLDVYPKIEQYLKIACKNNHVDIAKWLIKICPYSFSQKYYSDIFYDVCCDGFLKLAKCLFANNSHMCFYNNKHNLLELVCKYGHCHIVQWIFEIKPSMSKNFTIMNNSFIKSCAYGHLKLAMWLMHVYPDVDICDPYIFTNSCNYGNINIVVWLLKKNLNVDTLKNINISDFNTNNYYLQVYNKLYEKNTFLTVVKNNHDVMLKFLVSLFPNIMSNVNHTDVFHDACINNSLACAKLLVSYTSINIIDICHPLFCKVCKHGIIDVAKWLHSFNYINMDDFYAHDFTKLFCIVCNKNYLTTAKWLFSLRKYIENYDYASILGEIFINACMRGNIDMAKWIYSLKRFAFNHNSINYNDIFMVACKFEYFDIAEWLLFVNTKNTSNSFDIELCEQNIFKYACVNNKQKLIQWLLFTNQSLDIEPYEYDLLYFACSTNCYDVANYILSISSPIDISKDNDKLFRVTCKFGHLQIAKLLFATKPDIDINAVNDYAFRFAGKHYTCTENNKLAILKWLLSVNSNINIHADDEFAMHFACNCNHHTITKFLYDINPEQFDKVIYQYTNTINALNLESINKYFKATNYDGIFDMKNIIVHTNNYDIPSECDICNNSFNDNILVSCGHHYCKKCFAEYYFLLNSAKMCSFCRQNLYENNDIHIYVNKVDDVNKVDAVNGVSELSELSKLNNNPVIT